MVDVRNRKRQLNCNSGLNLKNKQTASKYDTDFGLELKEKNTFLATAVVRVRIGKDEFIKVRAFMDMGAQPNCVSFSLYSNELKERINTAPIARRMIGINGQSFQVKQKIILDIFPWFGDEPYERDIFWVMPKQAGWQPYMPNRKLNPFKIRNKSEIELADPNYWLPEQVHLLFGVGLFAKIIISVVDRTVDGTALMETKFGVIIFGMDSDDLDDWDRCKANQVLSAIEYKEEEQLDKLMERLWQQDIVPTAPKLTKEHLEVERHYLDNFERDATGRFTVRIPLKRDIPCFGSSREIALKRFMYLERKFRRDPRVKAMYIEKMRESMRVGHMVQATERPKPNELVYYIPHHCIDKDDRIVYDASCKTDTGISLNQIQMLGPKLQKDLYETIMRFRRHRIAVYADIKKMFNQVKLAKDQWNLQRIFWRENENEPLREYWLTVVIFGMTSSAHLAVRSVIQAATEEEDRLPLAAKAIKEDFYMDDCVTGSDTVHGAIELAKQTDEILKGAGFELRKWKSNNNTVRNALESEREKAMLFEVEDNSTILGLKWEIEEDRLTFIIKKPNWDRKITKRSISSHVAQLYDPNGYITPITIRGRILMQDLWKAKISWDEELDQKFVDRWTDIWKDIACVEQFKIDRWLSTGKEVKIQIHGFADSSMEALGANIYVRIEDIKGKISCNLLTTKSRIVPIKTVTLVKLELSAAELLGRLVKQVMRTMEWPTVEYVLWTDSSAVYYWIRKEPCTLKVYVANRVASIQENTKITNWNHVSGKENPADLLTRGVTPERLIGNEFWLHGPNWLCKPRSEWQLSKVMGDPPEDALLEVKVNSVTHFNDLLRIGLKGQKRNVPLLEYTSKLEKALNIISYVNRFINIRLGKIKLASKRNRRGEVLRKIAPPSNEEKAQAMMYLIRKAQQEFWNREITAIMEKNDLPEKSKLESLKPILDNEGTLRLGGRLDRSELEYEMKHPFIIPHESRLAYLIMEQAHRLTKHGGVQIMMQFIRQKYWIPKLRNSLRGIVHKCVVCVRLNARMESQLMAELPKERVQIGKPFLYTGVDYAGPFELKSIGKSEERPRQKCWIAIFVCFKTRAVHIETVLGLSSIEFIACYERFIARRGRCEKIFSDNGTSFTGTEKELRRALEYWTEREMLDHLHARGTEWHFMAPAAPHQGGIYEAAVKSMKFHLKRIIGQKILPYVQFNTLLTQIEAILNSRPLNPLSDDFSDMQALTPGHFLVGEPLITPLPFVIDPKPTTVGVRLWRERQQMVKNFWERWSNEYLVTLQERKKWRREKESIRIGQMVVLKSENFPPSSWALGRVCELLPSKDGLIRTVIVETATNKLKRPVQKLCILPVDIGEAN